MFTNFGYIMKMDKNQAQNNSSTSLFKALIISVLSVFSTLVFAQNNSPEALQIPSFADLAEIEQISVVNVSSIYETEERDIDPRIEEFFEGIPFPIPSPHQRQRPSQSFGSGFVIPCEYQKLCSEGNTSLVITNYHVVRDTSEVLVKLSDFREIKATVVGYDELSDIALLSIEASGLRPVRLANNLNIRPGDWVFAIGSPFGFDYTVTSGIISAVDRAIPGSTYTPFIQTDVAINPGNSGGPLFNLKGEVIGVNSQIYSRSGGFQGISFSIPISIVSNVVNQLVEKGKVSRGWLGVQIQQVTYDVSQTLGLSRPAGALVAQVIPGSPAQKGGVQVEDVILEFDENEIIRSTDLPKYVGQVPAGSTRKLVVWRNNQTVTLNITIDELATEPEQPRTREDDGLRDSDGFVPRINIAVRNLTEEEREIINSDGVYVISVARGPAFDVGIRRGHVITRMNQTIIEDVESFESIVAGLPANRPILVQVFQGDSPTLLTIRIDE